MEIIDPSVIEPYRGLINYWGLQTVAMMLTALVIPRMKITSIFGALGIVLALGLVNATVWDTALPGIEIDGFAPAFVAPVVFTALSLAISAYGRDLDLLELGRQGAEMLGVVRDRLQTPAAPAPN